MSHHAQQHDAMITSCVAVISFATGCKQATVRCHCNARTSAGARSLAPGVCSEEAAPGPPVTSWESERAAEVGGGVGASSRSTLSP